MSHDRIQKTFDRCRQAGRSAFVAYICIGDPNPETSLEVARTLLKNGVDILELGMPFSDPLADGLTNQLAAQRALESGMTTEKTWELTRKLREEFPDAPLVYYCYFNQVFAKTPETFLCKTAEAGADGVLILDLPPEESSEILELSQKNNLANIFIVAPTTSEQRLQKITAVASGFIYYVSREGVTGVRDQLASGLDTAMARIRKATSLPVVVGFGISTQQHVRDVARIADGVVVGSALVNQVAASPKDSAQIQQNLSQLMQELVPGLNHA